MLITIMRHAAHNWRFRCASLEHFRLKTVIMNALRELRQQRPDSPAVAVPLEGADLVEERLEERALLRRESLMETLDDLERGRSAVDRCLVGN